MKILTHVEAEFKNTREARTYLERLPEELQRRALVVEPNNCALLVIPVEGDPEGVAAAAKNFGPGVYIYVSDGEARVSEAMVNASLLAEQTAQIIANRERQEFEERATAAKATAERQARQRDER